MSWNVSLVCSSSSSTPFNSSPLISSTVATQHHRAGEMAFCPFPGARKKNPPPHSAIRNILVVSHFRPESAHCRIWPPQLDATRKDMVAKSPQTGPKWTSTFQPDSCGPRRKSGPFCSFDVWRMKNRSHGGWSSRLCFAFRA